MVQWGHVGPFLCVFATIKWLLNIDINMFLSKFIWLLGPNKQIVINSKKEKCIEATK